MPLDPIQKSRLVRNAVLEIAQRVDKAGPRKAAEELAQQPVNEEVPIVVYQPDSVYAGFIKTWRRRLGGESQQSALEKQPKETTTERNHRFACLLANIARKQDLVALTEDPFRAAEHLVDIKMGMEALKGTEFEGFLDSHIETLTQERWKGPVLEEASRALDELYGEADFRSVGFIPSKAPTNREVFEQLRNKLKRDSIGAGAGPENAARKAATSLTDFLEVLPYLVSEDGSFDTDNVESAWVALSAVADAGAIQQNEVPLVQQLPLGENEERALSRSLELITYIKNVTVLFPPKDKAEQAEQAEPAT